MKKIFSAILAAMLVAGTMVLPTAAADGDVVYLQTFDNVASYDDLGWEIVETLTTNTSTYTIENGALTVDNLGGNDSYTVVVPASVMDEVNKGDYTVGYDFTLLESGDTARYLAMLINYDREIGNTYNSLHMRMKGYADWQNRFAGTWSTNLDLNGGYNGLSPFTSQDTDDAHVSISKRLFDLPFDGSQNVIAGKTIRYEMRVSNSGQYCETYMNGVLISGTDEAGWDQFTWASEDYSEICLKSGGSILGTVDNIVVVKGLGIPEGTIPAMGEAAAPAADAGATANIEYVQQDYPNMDVIEDPGEGFATLEEAAKAIGKTAITGYTYITGTEGFANEGPENLWDNDTATKFCTGTSPIASIVALDGEYAIDGIIMATANDNASYNNRSPFEWAIYGSKDGASWTALAYGDDYFFEETDFTYYAAPLTTEGSYSYIMFQSENGLSGTFQVSEVVVCGTKTGDAAAPAATEAAPAEAPAATTTATAPAVGELQNLALGAKVEVSGTETAELVGELAVDGDMTTRWASDYVDEAYITLDLGTPIPVGYLEIYWETACPQDYVVETSSNGTEWTNVATVTGNTMGASPAGDAVIHEFTPATARFIRITTSKRNTEYGNSIWEIVARASKDAVVTETSGAYPASATEVPDGSVIINGARIGIETGWGDNAATGRDAAFDGDTATFFDPLGTGDGYCGVDAGEEMILTKILIHPRDGQLPRFNGATIEGANEEDFSDAVALYISVEEASEFAWIDVSDEIETADNTGYRYFRYINYTNHGDVAEVELYGYAVDGTNPGVVEAAPVEEAPVVEEPVVEAPVEEAPAEEVVVEEPVVEEPAEEAPVAEEVVEEVVEEAAQTFDFGVIAAVAALISAAGYAISKKR